MDIADIKQASATIGEGVWKESRVLKGVRLHVLSSTSPAVSRAFRRMARAVPMSQRTESGAITEETEAQLEAQVLSDVALLGWDGITSDGKPVKFSRDLARDMMQSDLFREAVTQAAESAAIDQAKVTLALEKN